VLSRPDDDPEALFGGAPTASTISQLEICGLAGGLRIFGYIAGKESRFSISPRLVVSRRWWLGTIEMEEGGRTIAANRSYDAGGDSWTS